MDPIFTGILTPLSWALCIASFVVSIALGAILYYHWYRYAMNPPLAFITIAAYSVVAGFLVLAILGAAFGVQQSY